MPADRFFNFIDDFFRLTEGSGDWAADQTKHLDFMEEFLGKCRQARLRLKISKSEHGVAVTDALGFTYGEGSVAKSEEAVQAMVDYPEPEGARAIGRFLSLASVYAHFLPLLSDWAKPLRKLEKVKRWKNDAFDGAPREAFVKIRDELARRTRLTLPNWDKMFYVRSDSGNAKKTGGMGGALLQEDDEGFLVPVAFASRTLSRAENGYGAPELEMGGIRWLVQLWETFLKHNHFIVFTDCECLKWAKSRDAWRRGNGRIGRWFLALAAFSFDVLWVKRSEVADADALGKVAIGIEKRKLE